MTLYMIVIETTSKSGEIHFDVAEIYDNEKKAIEVVDRFNKMKINQSSKYGYPEASIHTAELNVKTIEFERLERLGETN